MKRKLTLTLALLTMPAAFGMKYDSPTLAISPVTVIGINPVVNNLSACASDSNTIAVGYETYGRGFRILCADAGRIGFWTTPVASTLVGQQSAQSTMRFVCPSGMALAGLQYIEGLIFPFALCGELIPDFSTGRVQRTLLFAIDGTGVEKLAKADYVPGVVSCGPAGFIQTLKATRDTAGNVNGMGYLCNAITTAPANIEDVSVDLAVKTVGQPEVFGRNQTKNFDVDVFNLGIGTVPASNITLELRFDGQAWQVLPFNMACTAILAHSGVVDRIVVGERCTLPSNVAGRGGVVSVTFRLQPLGPDVTRPANSTPTPVLSVKAILIDENAQGADANSANDSAAFPQILK